MEEVVGGIFGAIGAALSSSMGAAHRAIGSYDGRRVRWTTVTAASLASALFAPMVVAAGFGLKAAWVVLNDDFLWIAAVFIGGLFVLMALLLFALAISAVGLGVAIGGWLLVDRPAARWYAGFYAVGGLAGALFLLSMETWVTRVVGWSTVGLAVPLLVAVVLPVAETGIEPGGEPAAPETADDPLPALTQPVTERSRFVL